MIVTARATDCHPQKCLGGGAQDVIKIIVTRQRPISRLIIPNAQSIKTRGCDGSTVLVSQLITGKLLHNKAVVGLIFIEGGYHIVTIPPDQILLTVTLITIGLGKAHQIQPMTAPLLTVLWTG